MIKLTYISYILISTTLVIYVGSQCHKNGKIYILNFFKNQKKYGNTINDLLRTAYYLLNIGLAIWNLHSIKNISNSIEIILEISSRLSFIILTIGLLHMINIYMITLIHKHLNKQL